MTDTTHPCILAVDGGASSTLALIAAPDGAILGAGLAGPCNHVHEPGGMERMENALRGSILAALREAGREIQDISHVCLGLTGGLEAAGPISARLLSHLPRERIRIEWDQVTALAGASVGRPGVVVIAGTGSVAWGERSDGQTAKAGGWGYLFDDEGSAYDLGRRALHAAVCAEDGRGPQTRLHDMLLAHFGKPDVMALFLTMATWASDRPTIARLAALVSAAAAEGDSVARALLAQAGRDLAVLPLTVIRKLGQTEAGMSIYTTGGVFQAGEWVLRTFRESIAAETPASRVYPAVFTPVIGSLLLALRDAGCALNETLIANIRASLPGTAISKHKAIEDEG